MKNVNVGDVVYSANLKGVSLFDDVNNKYTCTGICFVKEDYKSGMIELLCFASNDEGRNVQVLGKVVYLQDEVFIKYDINEELSKAMKEMQDRYQQLQSMKDKSIKEEVMEYCRKVENNICTLINIKRMLEKRIQ